jgi:hypothetical protein
MKIQESRGKMLRMLPEKLPLSEPGSGVHSETDPESDNSGMGLD